MITIGQPQGSNGGGTGLAVNVDVANGSFWVSQGLHQAARNLCCDRNPDSKLIKPFQ
jgi:eukaryotic translation initiation factor 2C